MVLDGGPPSFRGRRWERRWSAMSAGRYGDRQQHQVGHSATSTAALSDGQHCVQRLDHGHPATKTAQARPPPTPDPPDRDPHARTSIHDVPHKRLPNSTKYYPPPLFPRNSTCIEENLGNVWKSARNPIPPPLHFADKFASDSGLPAKSAALCSEDARERRVFFV